MKKDPIDKLFEDKLRDYSEVPDEKVWKAIEHSLDKKRQSRKLIPIWWRLGGAAAVLALLVYLAGPLVFQDTEIEGITDTEDTRRPQSPNDEGRENESLRSSEPEGEITDTQEARESDSKAGKSGESLTSPALNERSLAGEPEIPPQNNPSSASESARTTDGLAAAGERIGSGKQAGIPEDPGAEKEDRLAGNTSGDKTDNPPRPVAPDSGEKQPMAGMKSADSTAVAVKEEQELPTQGRSIFEVIEEQEQEEALSTTEGSRWSVGPRVAPVYFNSFGQGSPIHSSFVANSKSGNINLSYGLALSYTITPKLSIRSGVHKVDYGYDTNEISFSPTLATATGPQINNINYALSSRNLVVRNASQEKIVQDAFAAEVSAEFPSRTGRMVQQFGYVEVPLELDYALVDRKLGFHLIGGLSSLFLVDNTVTLESDGNETEMGEANNLNSLNFSTNIGFGIDYELTPKLRLNLEPVFKYQLNTFSDTAGDFNPYSIGVYSGLNFRF